MFDDIRTFREKLSRGEFCLGAGVSFFDPSVSEALGAVADFLWIDQEHCPISIEAVQAHVIAARAARVPALVRTPGSEVSFIKPVLDSGATGLIVPQVTSVEEVERVVSACRYPPLGTRGFGPRRPSNYGRAPIKDYLAEANRDLFVSVQIENKHALAVVEEIAAVPRLDSLVIGPADLSLSLGISMKDPQLREAMRRIVAAARARGLSVGIGMGPDDDDFAVEAIGLGVNWLQVGGDFSYMVSFAAGLYGRIRERAKG